jgi:hypothetical protein
VCGAPGAKIGDGSGVGLPGIRVANLRSEEFQNVVPRIRGAEEEAGKSGNGPPKEGEGRGSLRFRTHDADTTMKMICMIRSFIIHIISAKDPLRTASGKGTPNIASETRRTYILSMSDSENREVMTQVVFDVS